MHVIIATQLQTITLFSVITDMTVDLHIRGHIFMFVYFLIISLFWLLHILPEVTLNRHFRADMVFCTFVDIE